MSMKQQEYNQSSKMVSKSSRINCPIFRYSSLLLFLAITVVAAQAQDTQYSLIIDYTKGMSKAYDLDSSFVLQCRISPKPKTHIELTWWKEGEKLTNSEQIQIKSAEHSITFRRMLESDAGEYECKAEELNLSTKVSLLASPLVKLSKNHYVVENEKLTIKCITYGTKVNVTWIVDNNAITESQGRINLLENNHILEMENVTLDDRGNFSCIATVEDIDKSFTGTTLVRVKGKYAALWPFLGICAEVFVLCAIILIYEKKTK